MTIEERFYARAKELDVCVDHDTEWGRLDIYAPYPTVFVETGIATHCHAYSDITGRYKKSWQNDAYRDGLSAMERGLEPMPEGYDHPMATSQEK